MKYQSFASGRGFDPNKTFDETQRVLNQAQTHIEGLRALNQADEQQSAALINNIRSQRQRDKEDDNENHELTMMSLKAAEVARQRQDEVNREAARQKQDFKSKQEERNLNNIINFAKTAGQVAGEAREGLIEKYIQEGKQEQSQRILELVSNRQTTEVVKEGVKGNIHNLEVKTVADQVQSSLAKAQGQPRSFWEKLLVNESTVQVYRQQGRLNQAYDDWVSGGQELYLSQNKDKKVTINRNGENVELSYGEIGTLSAGEEYLQAINQVNAEYFQKVIGTQGNPDLAAEIFTKLNSFNLSEVKRIQTRHNQGLRNEQIDFQKENFFTSSGSLGASALKSLKLLSGDPSITYVGGKQVLVDRFKLLSNSQRQQFMEEFSQLSWENQPGVKIGRLGQDGLPVDPTFRELQLTHQRQLSVQSENYNKQQEEIGNRVGEDASRVAYQTGSPDGTKRFTENEQQQALDRVLDLHDSGKLSWVAYKAATRKIRSNFDSFEDLNRAEARIQEVVDNYGLTEEFIQEELNSRNISEARANELREELAKYAPSTPGLAFGFSTEDRHKAYLNFLSKHGSYFDPEKNLRVVDGSIVAAASMAASDYASLVEKYKQTMLLGDAQMKAHEEVQAELDKFKVEGSRYMMTNHSSGNIDNRAFMNRFKAGNHPYALQLPSRNIESSSKLGAEIKANPSILLSPDFEVFDPVLESMANQARMGKEITMTPHMKDTQVASGLDRDDFVKRLFSGREEYKDIKITEGSFAQAKKAIEKNSPHLKKFFDNYTIPNSNVIRNNQSVNILAPAQGQGQANFNGHAISTKKLNLLDDRLVAAIAYIRSDYKDGPLQDYYTGIQAEVDQMMLMESPPPILRQAQETLVAFNAQSSSFPLGQSRTGARLMASAQASTMKREVIRGASELGIDPLHLGMVMNFETAGSLVSGKYRSGMDIPGGDGNNYLGGIQFSPDNQRRYGVTKGMSPSDHMNAIVNYLRDNGVQPGDSLETIYQAIQAPAYVERTRQSGRNIGADSNDSVSNHVQRIRDEHGGLIKQWLGNP